MEDNFTDDIKEIIKISKEIAKRNYSNFIDTAHLFLALIEHSENDAIISIKKKFNLSEIEKRLKNHINQKITNELKLNFRENFELTRFAERALKTTFLESKIFNNNKINSFHLVLCILRNEGDLTTKILNKSKLYYENFKSIYQNFNLLNPEINIEVYDDTKEIAFYYSDLVLNIRLNEDDKSNHLTFSTTTERTNYLSNILNNNNNAIHSLTINEITSDERKIINNFSSLYELTILDSNLIFSIDFIYNHKMLKKLKICNSKLKYIDGIKNLVNIEYLDLSRNKIIKIEEINSLNKLKFFDISYNNVSDINILEQKINNGLSIFFHENKIEKVNELILINFYESNSFINLDFITSLKNIYVHNKKYEIASVLRDLEKQFEKNVLLSENTIQNIKSLYLEYSFKSNPIQYPPLEIILEGQENIKDFFKQIEKDKRQSHLFESKLLIIGEGGTGKTSFARKMEDLKSILPTEEETTFNIDVKQIEFKTDEDSHSKMFINIWDFGGQKIYRGTHQLFFSDKCLYVLVDDNREEKTDFSYWINTVQQIAGNGSKLIIIINLKHGRKNYDFDEIGYKKQFPIINDVIKIDLSNDIDELTILKELIKVRFRELPLIGSPLPISWVEIRQKLSNIKENYISFDYFTEICKSYSIDDISTINTICSYFDNIGVIIFYGDDPILKERIYLNSNWLVDTIYEVLDNEIIDKKNGILEYDEVTKIWSNKNLELEIDRLCALMNKFGLMYQIIGSKKFVIPEKLPKEMPYKKWDYDDLQLLKFRYVFEKYNPKGMMSKLIVSLNKYIKNQLNVWHRGLNIEYENTFAEIIETYNINNTFEIKIAGENKTGLLAIIIDKFDEILKIYKNLNYEKFVQCNCVNCINDNNPHFFKHSDLLKRREKNIENIECEKEYDKVNVICLLEGIKNNNSKMNKIEIFLASSNELKIEREQFEIFINRENKKLIEKGIFINLNLWEDFIDSISKTRLQDEYNKVAINCDIFISLFSTKVGIYTEEEFEKAYENFIKNEKPKYVYTFFKNEKKGMNEIIPEDFETLINFKDKLKKINHFPTPFEDTNDLLRQIKQQLDKILN